jgi:hypothetical protein
MGQREYELKKDLQFEMEGGVCNRVLEKQDSFFLRT